jgi:AcrR family transcriptional regulator
MDTTYSADTSDPAQARREQILAAAAAVFAEKGYPRSTIKEIAGTAGLAPGTIYLYFKNKRHLLLAIAERLIAQSMSQLLTESANLTPEAYVKAVLQERMHFAGENKAFLQALVTEIWTDGEIQQLFFTQIMGPLFALGAGYVQAQVEQGRLRPARLEIILPAVAGSIVMLSAFRALAPEYVLPGLSEEEVVTEVARLFLHGLALDPQESVE